MLALQGKPQLLEGLHPFAQVILQAPQPRLEVVEELFGIDHI